MRRFVPRLCTWIGLLALLVGAGEARAERNLEGTWRGTLDAGAAKLRLVVTLERSQRGAYRGVLESVDQGATIPIDKISVRANRVSLEVGRVGGTYEGALSKNDTELTGTWKQAGTALPLSFEKDKAEAPAPRPEGKPPFHPPLDVLVPIAPTAFRANGKHYLAYELHVTNFGGQEVALERVEALDGGGRKTLSRRTGLDLATSVGRPGASDAAGLDKLRVGPGLRAVLYMWIALDGTAIPSSLDHRIAVTVGGRELAIACARIQVGRDVPVVGAPLRGGSWKAANGPSNESLHRRALMAIGGRAVIAQRFAIDFVRLRPDGSTFTGDPSRNQSYLAHGAEALAVVDGTVAATKDGIPENVPGPASRAVPITLETVLGNHVILDIGQGRFASYAHLQPGSLRVKVGDRVRRGQVLGLVGNSGNSTEPHLHFDMNLSPSFLASEGVPYHFTSFSTRGAKPGAPPREHRGELPLENDVVSFSK